MPIINPKRLFVIDGSGALLSAFFLAIVLVKLDIGMPNNILYFLAALPCIFALYSFGCYFLIKSNWPPYLKGIALANLFYCCLTIGLIAHFYENLTTLGFCYFLLELLVVGILITIELRASANNRNSKS